MKSLVKPFHPLVSPLVVMGVLVVLLPLFAYMTLDRMEKQKEHIRDRMQVRGASLIRTFEAGTRTGMLTMRWGVQRIQSMLVETAVQPDISYIMITDNAGKILAHSDNNKVGTTYGDMPETGPVQVEVFPVFSRIRQDDREKVFEVYKRFVPLRSGGARRHMHGRMPLASPHDHAMRRGWGMQPPPGEPDFSGMAELYIFAGLSMEKMAELEGKMARAAIGRGILFFFLGCAGVIALFAFQAYRAAKTSLDRVQAFSDNVVQNMPSGLLTLDNAFKITSANRAARQILGKLPEQAFPGMVQMAKEVEKTRQPLSREVTLASPSGRELSLDMTASVILGDDSDIQGYVFLFRDLTRLQTLLREVETNRRLAAIGKLAGGVAHEIRNPLSSIKGFATYFGKRYQDNPDDAETATIMVQEVERINRSITQLLEFANPMAVEKKQVEIAPLIRHSLKLVAHDLDREGISYHVAFENRYTWMLTDPDRINQVLLNLYMNAVTAMDRGGRLEVTVADLPGDGAGGIQIHVRDNGCGIDIPHLEDIFDPYFTTRPTGTGLGLSIVHRIMENLGGDIRVESEKGKGSTFTVLLPGAAMAGENKGNP